jgi:uncharacterized protein YqjF (DUF2071 family)
MQEAAEILRVTNHRPWKLPRGPWLMMQRWSDLLFAHWPVAPEVMRPLVPNALDLDTFEGTCWLAVTPFELWARPRGLPTLSHFPELNCRTYVTYRGKPGVFFFSLDAGSRFAVWGARTFYRLPYFYSRMRKQSAADGIHYVSRRPEREAVFMGQYQSNGTVRRSEKGSLEHWLTERYCLYTCMQERVYHAEIHHVPWPLQEATCEIQQNTIAAAAGIRLPETAPLLHFSRQLDVLIWPLRRAG